MSLLNISDLNLDRYYSIKICLMLSAETRPYLDAISLSFLNARPDSASYLYQSEWPHLFPFNRAEPLPTNSFIVSENLVRELEHYLQRPYSGIFEKRYYFNHMFSHSYMRRESIINNIKNNAECIIDESLYHGYCCSREIMYDYFTFHVEKAFKSNSYFINGFMNEEQYKLYIHNKIKKMLPNLLDYKINAKKSFSKPDKIFENLESDYDKDLFLFNLDVLNI